MSTGTSPAAKALFTAAALPALLLTAVVLVLAGGGGNPPETASACGGGGTAQTVGGIDLDAEQMGNARTVITVAAGRQVPARRGGHRSGHGLHRVEAAQLVRADRPRLGGALP